MDLSEVKRLLDPQPMALEMGWERLSSGVLHVAVRTDMHRCSGEMLEWWFSKEIPTRDYRWWHPLDHIESQSSGGQEGQIVGRMHLIEECFTGTPAQKLAIQFRPPEEFFANEDVAAAKKRGDVSALICARGGMGYEPMTDPAGAVLGTRLIHVGRNTEWGMVLRSHFFLGQDLPDAGMSADQVSAIFPDNQAAPLLQHGYDEFTYLSRVLPSIWMAEGADQKELTRPW